MHFVDDEYDHGPIVAQHTVPVLEDDTPERLAERPCSPKYEAYPEAIRLFAEGRFALRGDGCESSRPFSGDPSGERRPRAPLTGRR